MRKRLSNFLAVLSLALFLLFVAAQIHWWLQPHSDSYSPLLAFHMTGAHVVLFNSLHVEHQTRALENNSRYSNGRYFVHWHGAGFEVSVQRLVNYPRGKSPGDNQTVEWGPVAEWGVAVPCWLLILVTVILPARRAVPLAKAIRRRWGQRRPEGFCSRCGYDLRATPDRCPECGAPRAAVIPAGVGGRVPPLW